MNVRFTPEQVEHLSLSIPHLASEPVVATALNLPVATVRRWRMDGTGPAYYTAVNGQTIYQRNSVIAFMRRNMEAEQ